MYKLKMRDVILNFTLMLHIILYNVSIYFLHDTVKYEDIILCIFMISSKIFDDIIYFLLFYNYYHYKINKLIIKFEY